MSVQKQYIGLNLNEDEKSMLHAFVGSPVFKIFLKIAEHDRQQCMNLLATSNSIEEIHRLQGRIAGVNVVENIPKIIAQKKSQEIKEAKEKAEKKLKKNGS